MSILAMIGGLRGVVVAAGAAMVAASLTAGSLRIYDRLIDDPAVEKAAKAGMVAIARLETAQAERDAQLEIAAAFRRMAGERQRIAEQEAQVRQAFEIKAFETDAINAKLQGDLDAILSAPAAMACDLSGVFGRLRNP